MITFPTTPEAFAAYQRKPVYRDSKYTGRYCDGVGECAVEKHGTFYPYACDRKIAGGYLELGVFRVSFYRYCLDVVIREIFREG